MPRQKKTPPVPIVWRNHVTAHPEIDAKEWAVAMALSMKMDNKTGECYPGIGTLVGITKLSRASVKRALNGLEDKMLLERRRRRISRYVNDTTYYRALGVGSQGSYLGSQGADPRLPADEILGSQGAPVSSRDSSADSIAPEGAQSRKKRPCPYCGGSELSWEEQAGMWRCNGVCQALIPEEDWP